MKYRITRNLPARMGGHREGEEVKLGADEAVALVSKSLALPLEIKAVPKSPAISKSRKKKGEFRYEVAEHGYPDEIVNKYETEPVSEPEIESETQHEQEF